MLCFFKKIFSSASNQDINLKKRGNEYLASGNLAKAEECYRQYISDYPNDAEGYVNLGFILSEKEQFDQVEHYLLKAISLDSTQADSFYFLGLAKESQHSYVEAIECYEKALKINPTLEPAYSNLCHAYFVVGNISEAKKIILEGISINPSEADFHFYLANLYLAEGDYVAAVQAYEKALTLNPKHSQAYINLGKAFEEQGNIKAAGQAWNKVIEFAINANDPFSRKLFALTFDESACAGGDYLKEAKRFGELIQKHSAVHNTWLTPLSEREDKPLRIGLVSGDLRKHPVGYFLENVIARVDRKHLQFWVYSTWPKEDELTQNLKTACSSWMDISYLSDEQAAKKIRNDEVDILIDLAGHTGHNRLALFGWKPAPIQVTWLGYWASTGIPAIDYVLADEVSVPVFQQNQFTEKVWYLPDTRMCFSAPTESVAVGVLPANNNGYITFGSFQNMSKISDDVLAIWSKVLNAIPTARLRLQNKQLNDERMKISLNDRLTKVGITPERVTMMGSVSRQAYLEAHSGVDIILDTFPFTGGTTTCEALWMGVPTVTLAGDTMIARQGASMLTCVGLKEWVANTKEEYMTIAVNKANDINALAQLRVSLREQVRISPLFNAELFARNFENAVIGMWKEKLSSLVQNQTI